MTVLPLPPRDTGDLLDLVTRSALYQARRAARMAAFAEDALARARHANSLTPMPRAAAGTAAGAGGALLPGPDPG